VFAFRPECCPELERNGVRIQTGIAFAFDGIPQKIFYRNLFKLMSIFVCPGSLVDIALLLLDKNTIHDAIAGTSVARVARGGSAHRQCVAPNHGYLTERSTRPRRAVSLS